MIRKKEENYTKICFTQTRREELYECETSDPGGCGKSVPRYDKTFKTVF